ncbi:MAG: MFS transporter, partial [Hyphomonadaceae bacterium]|nr:MFS transporter [Hyphomonadaceae bacterium]
RRLGAAARAADAPHLTRALTTGRPGSGQSAQWAQAAASPPADQRRSSTFNLVLIGVIAFLTVVDLFATQAILPALAAAYRVSPAAMGTAVNAAAIGMAIASLLAATLSGRVDRRNVITGSLVLLALPTALLSQAPNLAVFTALRVVQGALMATAFTLTLAHLGERCTLSASPAAFAAYVTGNVASNLFGRLLSASVVGYAGVEANFFVFAVLNLLGGALVWATLSRAPPLAAHGAPFRPWESLARHWRDPRLRAACAIGFCILFAFLGVFTYVNFVLTRAPLDLPMAYIGVVYFVFAPSIVTTPLAGRLTKRIGPRGGLWFGLALAALGLPCLLASALPIFLAGMVLVAAGAFFAQAVATGFVSQVATVDRGAASGLYLAFYFAGGLAGSAMLGWAFERAGWTAVILGVGGALLAATCFTYTLPKPTASLREA